MKFFTQVFFLFLFTCFSFSTYAQDNKKYPALLWEITGNNLKKPSYLFGTMHVSNKLAFHLSDSFYYALKNVDAVALELNPEVWQPEMIRLNRINENYSTFSKEAGGNYFTQNSFRIKNFDKELQAALSSEPPVVNSLLYRSYEQQQDFEEDTFLDLYIFQTGRKLGKKPAGVENYYESEKLVFEAYMDMAKEKKKPEVDLAGETRSSLVEKLQNAYRRGDLDLMDSINTVLENSKAFTEKFLYKRNDIQAKSIDTILQNRSLFVGVGAAHLPGPRGVIEQLRAMGYRLRPMKMTDRDAAQKELLEKVTVPVHFTTQYSADSIYSVSVPGTLYSLQNDRDALNRRQYADMNNGSYYMVTRVKTYASFLGKTTEEILSKTDSLLYENIPGRIISKIRIEKNGYKGWDITNRTRTGNLQRYQIFASPFEVFIFKMSGREEYVAGTEATTFFSSINLRNNSISSELNSIPGLDIMLPGAGFATKTGGEEERWEYESKAAGASYLVMKKTINNYDFIAEDSFDIGLMHESFINPDIFGENLYREWGEYLGYKALYTRDKLKDSGYVNSIFLLKGADYYGISKKTMDAADSSFAFSQAITWAPYKYGQQKLYIDSFLNFSVQTPVIPVLDAGIRKLIEKSVQDISNGNNANGTITYWHNSRNAVFKDENSGQVVGVYIQEYPKYFSLTDSAKYWKDLIDAFVNEDMVLASKQLINNGKDIYGYKFTLSDTGSTRHILRQVMIADNKLFVLSTMSSSSIPDDAFKQSFFSSFKPYKTDSTFNPLESKTVLYFDDLHHGDSATHALAIQAVSNVDFVASDAPMLTQSINGMSIHEKDYFSVKTKFIAALGYISEGDRSYIPDLLTDIYNKTADTVLFQNEVLYAMARQKSKKAFTGIVNIMMKDPPVFESRSDYFDLFSLFTDTLELSQHYIKDLMAFTTISDYKEPVHDLLKLLVDSGFVTGREYKQYFTPLYIDSRMALKKQKAKDENKMKEALLAEQKPEEAEENNDSYNYDDTDEYDIYQQAVLMMPFYNKQKNVRELFDKILTTENKKLLLTTAILMERNGHTINQEIWRSLASEPKYASQLYFSLKKIKALNLFPKEYLNQEYLAKSNLLSISSYKKVDSLQLMGEDIINFRNENGRVYFYRYRIKPNDEWRIAISGLQPLDKKNIDYEDNFTSFTEKTLVEYEPLMAQFKKELKKLEYDYRKSGKYFYIDDDNNRSIFDADY